MYTMVHKSTARWRNVNQVGGEDSSNEKFRSDSEEDSSVEHLERLTDTLRKKDKSEEVSRLFYLQLYSSVLKTGSSENADLDEVSQHSDQQQQQDEEELYEKMSNVSMGMELERDVGDSYHTQQRRSYRSLSGQSQPPQAHYVQHQPVPVQQQQQQQAVVQQQAHLFQQYRPGSGRNQLRHANELTDHEVQVVQRHHALISAAGTPTVVHIGNGSTTNSSVASNANSQHTQPSSSPRLKVEPVLNTRMKNLTSNFTLRYNEDQLHNLNPSSSNSQLSNSELAGRNKQCTNRQFLCNTLYLGLAGLSLVLVLFLVLNRPESYQPFYEAVYVRDTQPEVRPQIGLCLGVPFLQNRLREFRVASPLSSFLMIALSPFHTNREILEDQVLLTELTAQYRRLNSRITQRSGRNNSKINLDTENEQLSAGSTKRGLYKVMRTLAPRCDDVIVGCKVGSAPGESLSGEDCCQLVFDRVDFNLQGLCFVASDFTRVARESAFPLTPAGDLSASLSVIVNATALEPVDVDNRLVQGARRHTGPSILASVVSSRTELGHRNIRRDIQLKPGETVDLSILKRGVDNTAPGTALLGGCAYGLEQSQDLFGDALFSEASCRSSVIQMIAERSVNCSLISLPKIEKSLPFCGPLESLALMYILREQGSLVSLNPDMMERFESGVNEKCPVKCYYQFFQPEVSWAPRNLPLENSKPPNRFFQIEDSQDLAAVNIRYHADPLIRVHRYHSGLFQLLHRLGDLCASSLMLLLLVFVFKQLWQRKWSLWHWITTAARPKKSLSPAAEGIYSSA